MPGLEAIAKIWSATLIEDVDVEVTEIKIIMIQLKKVILLQEHS